MKTVLIVDADEARVALRICAGAPKEAAIETWF